MRDPILDAFDIDDSDNSDSEFFGVSKKVSKKKPIDSVDDPDGSEYQDYTNLSNQEKKEKIRKLQIGNEKDLRTLIEKDLVTSIFGEMSQSIQNNVIDQAKRKANTWANLLGIPGKERDIEGLLSDLGEEIVNGLTGDIVRLSDDGVFE